MLSRCQLLSIALLLFAHAKTLEKLDGYLTKVHFLLFSETCIVRKFADLLDFMLHRLLSTVSVNIVCCHNASPHTLSQLTWGCFKFYIWRLSLQQTLPFISPL